VDDDVFVGRNRELADLERRLTSARQGDGALVLVEGDAGLGKTALAHSLVRRARRAGVRVAWGACLEGEGAPAYRPWVQILRELGESATLLLDPAGGESGSRFHVFDDVAEALRSAATDRGLLLVVDDLHCADVPSMRLLQAVGSAVADSRLLVLGLFRGPEAFPHAELAGALGAVLRERAATQMTLAGLTPPEVAQLTARALGRRPDEALVRMVQRRAEGNPLFVLELVRLVAASGQVESVLPDSVREVIERRLDRLPPATRQLLRHAAVLGREFTADVLSALVDEPPDHLFDLLDPALAAALLRVGDDHTLRFAHVLTQDVLYAELPTAVRQRLHARAADALKATATEGPVDALAHHLRLAAPTGGADEALRVTREAAVRARSQLAYEHAAFQYRAALGLLP
jgi:predicted ATPase